MTKAQGLSQKWLILFLLAGLWHLLWMWLAPQIGSLSPQPLPKLEVQQIDTSKLDAIRRQWKEEEKKSVLLHSKQPKAESAPENARFISDRNIRVEKEQRARQTQVLPRPGSSASHPEQAAQESTRPKLSDLGVKMRSQKKPRSMQTGASHPVNAPGGDQAILDRDLPEGGENLLNAQESVYYSFYARIYEAIAPVWQSLIRNSRPSRPVGRSDYVTFVEVVIDGQGNLVEVIHHRSSGILEFDRAVDEAWKKISRFPNPPRGLLQADGTIHMGWNFTVQIGEGAQWQFLPPERSY